MCHVQAQASSPTGAGPPPRPAFRTISSRAPTSSRRPRQLSALLPHSTTHHPPTPHLSESYRIFCYTTRVDHVPRLSALQQSGPSRFVLQLTAERLLQLVVTRSLTRFRLQGPWYHASRAAHRGNTFSYMHLCGGSNLGTTCPVLQRLPPPGHPSSLECHLELVSSSPMLPSRCVDFREQ